MDYLKVYQRSDIDELTRTRKSELKFGQMVQYSSNNWETDLLASNCLFVLVGIPEDIGVRANSGRAGASTAVKPAFESILNQQHNNLFDATTVFVLGEIEVGDLMASAQTLNQKNEHDLTELRVLTAQIDARVIPVIETIVRLKKIPIVIGGGHNNAFGNIVGSSKALKKSINVINCDPHLDFRISEGRHSGNGFSYAYQQNYLNKYAVLAMHEQYNNDTTLNEFKEKAQRLYYSSFEAVFVRSEYTYMQAVQQCIGFVKGNTCGVEIDMDAITNVPSSAKTSSGITALEARQFVYQSARQLDVCYFHVAEAAPVLSHIKTDNKTGKLIAYLVTDFMKGVQDRYASESVV